MRAFCTVSAPLEVCAPPTRPLSPGSRFLALKLLGTPQPRTLYFLVEAKSRVREVYAQTCLYFAKQGMLDTELFGLAVLIDGEYFFADPESKLSKYGPKSWRSSHTHGLDANGRPLLEFHFRVQFYIESPLMLRDETTRHNYYLQLKVNTIGRDLPRDCAEQTIVLLGGLALQADLGDAPTTAVTAAAAAASDDGGGTSTPTGTADANAAADYFRLEDYVPASMRTAWYSQTLQSCHRKYRGMPKADAETHFIREVCNLKEAINAHYFRMKLSKSETGVGSVWLIVYAKGLKIYEENPVQTNTFLWPNISKLSFERKKFEIRSADSKIILYSANDEKNKMILALCRDTHQFSMKTAARLSEAIKREEEAEAEAAEQSQLGLHAYMYSRSLNLPYKNKNDQRISVISSTSSNTTSGIVSDRVHSEDELEIMINTPPATQIAAPSTESLALAHLLDKPSVSRQTSSVGRVSLKDLEDTLAALSIRSNTRSSGGGCSETASVDASDAVIPASESDSPNSQNNIGSQCSSTCSTVVVATDTIAMPSSPTTTVTAATRRRPSTSSSLELGFSHTAQNSALSEGQSACYGTTTLDNNDNDEDGASGVYNLAHPPPTETSGVYTMNSSEMTGQSSECAESESHASSSHYGSFQPMGGKNGDASVTSSSMDAVDGQFRMRSDSNVSASGSFRGDGSDPTDKKHALLSAEELTDLIVGRGTYPPRTTVSDTLDSDCDYVTLPLPLEGDSYLQGHEDTAPTDDDQYDDDLMPTDPPAPPKRVDSNVHRSLSCLLDIRMRSPPPYEARHETTGLCGPPVPARDPPPYPQPLPRAVPAVPVQPVHQQEQSTIPPPPIPNTSMPEEATARFITTRPHINILKANTSMVGEKAKPSYAVPSSISVPSMPYSMHAAHKSMSALSAPQPPPYPDMQKAPRTCLLLPVIKPRQYLPPPPPSLPRQPPPPPPTSSHQLATVYTSQLARSQIELYQQQLYSDVDYVIYPLQDPAVSQQEYLDAKQGSILAAMAQNGPPPPPSYLAYRTHHQTNGAIYRSTPYLSMTFSSPHSRYASTQNLSDTYVQLPSTYSPLYSPSVASLCSSYEPPPPPPLRPRPYHKQMHTVSAPMFVRSRSDDNILNSIETAPTHKQLRRLPPPPPPPPPYQCRKPLPKPPRLSPPPPLAAKKSDILRRTSLPIGAMPTGVAPQTVHPVHPVYPAPSAQPHPTTPSSPDSAIDINTLREKSKHLDLPLISALCNDRSLLKQTKAFVMPKHPKMGIAAQQQQQQSQQMQQHHQQQHLMMQQHQSQLHSMTTTGQLLMSSTPHMGKYPVSGLSTTQLQKPRKTSVSHRHPNDKLPPLPMHTAVAQCGNNYVLDPTPTAIKHKSYNSQT